MNQPQITVPTPPWLQRRMLRNLQQATKDRVNVIRAKKAEIILAKLKRNNEAIHSHSKALPVTHQATVHSRKSVKQNVRVKILRVMQYVKAVFNRCFKRVFTSLKQASLSRQTHGGYVINEKDVR